VVEIKTQESLSLDNHLTNKVI